MDLFEHTCDVLDVQGLAIDADDDLGIGLRGAACSRDRLLGMQSSNRDPQRCQKSGQE